MTTTSHHKELRLADALFDYLSENGVVYMDRFLEGVKESGLKCDDVRLKDVLQKFQNAAEFEESEDTGIGKEAFIECLGEKTKFITGIFRKDLTIPNFQRFTKQIAEIHRLCQSNDDGEVASFIPELARADPSQWGISFCTVDGQRGSIGEATTPFTIQSCTKSLMYALAVESLGSDYVHKYIGREPSGISFNKIKLDSEGKPHNPLINPGAICVSSLLLGDGPDGEKHALENVIKNYKRLSGDQYVGFSEATYKSESATANRNFALGYYLKENKCFPEGKDVLDILDLYFKFCSIEITCESGSIMAATLANGGICPITGERILKPEAVRNTLSLMHTCGMYDSAGNFAFEVGIPAKSGVSGVILLVVPNVMGICTWSPPLDGHGNSIRGIQFCQELVAKFNFHAYDNLVNSPEKEDPRKREMLDKDAVTENKKRSPGIFDITRIAIQSRRNSADMLPQLRPDFLTATRQRMKWLKFVMRTCRITDSLEN